MLYTNDLQNAIRKVVCECDPDEPVSAEMVASIVVHTLDPHHISPAIIRWGCELELRQMARAILRNQYEQLEAEGACDDMFPLQERYPGFGDNAGQYLPRAKMTQEDYMGNVARLRREAHSKLAHADKLESECTLKFGSIPTSISDPAVSEYVN